MYTSIHRVKAVKVNNYSEYSVLEVTCMSHGTRVDSDDKEQFTEIEHMHEITFHHNNMKDIEWSGV